ncbi:MAG: hypothetical protein Q7S37_02680 [bacterium]|nr:hypothetical protein [bacterium]
MSDLETFFQQFENWVLKDMRLILKIEDENGNLIEPDRTAFTSRRPLVAAVILMCCAIDCLARFRYGEIDRNVGSSFKNFVFGYFSENVSFSGKSYDKQKIYKGLRNALVHGYSLGRDLGLVHQSSENHLDQVNNRVIIDVFSLYYDLETAYNKYKQELIDGSYQEQFKRRWREYPLIQFITEENVKGR